MTLLRLVCVCLLVACGTDDPPAPPKVAVTAMGTPQGSPVSGVVTAAGGTLTSGDGVLTIDVPAGAVASDTTLTIQPITNEAPGALGAAYRLGPEGQTFAVPATLTFTYTDHEISASEPEALAIAFQDAIGQWHSNAITLDETAHTIQVQTPHFSDWSRVQGYQIRPGEQTLKLGETLQLAVEFCVAPKTAPDELAGLLYDCRDNDTEFLTELKWLVNGATADVTVQDATFGTIESDGQTATYTAPSAAPPGNPIAVSAEFRSSGRHVLLVANITVGQPPLSGTIDSTLDDEDGVTVVTHATASFAWNDALLGYTSTGGHFSVIYDMVEDDCTAHATGEADILPMDGYVIFVGGTQYGFGGSSMITLTGSITCASGTSPFSSSDVRPWWPSVDAIYTVHDDGSLVESIHHVPYGVSFVDEDWSLAPPQ